MPSQEFVLMAKVVNQISSRSDADPFRVPVDWKELGLFDYPEIIKKPMDLGQIKKKLEKDNYDTIHAAAEDVRLVWKNCMQYNADGSDFYLLAQSLSKRFEDKYAKLLKDLNIEEPGSSSSAQQQQASSNSSAEPSLADKRTFAKTLYKITKEELGKVIVDLDGKCPECLTKNQTEDEVEINVDKISPKIFHEVLKYANSCADGNSRKKKASSGKGSNKKARSS